MTKAEVVAEIARRLGFEPPPMSTGSTEPRLLFTMVIDRLGIETQASTKHGLARAIIEAADGEWRPEFASAGGTVTLEGLRAVLHAVSSLVPNATLRPSFWVTDVLPDTPLLNSMLLVEDPWDDTSPFDTAYSLVFVDARGSVRPIGSLKIGRRGMAVESERPRRPTLPRAFDELTDDFFSLGQEPDYYNRIAGLGADVAAQVLTALRDMAFDEAVYQGVRDEPVLNLSVLQTVPRSMMVGQFRRISRGGAKLTHFDFAFQWENTEPDQPVQIDFHVEPNSMPPTNLHAIIGRNGAGKTRILQAMAYSAVQGARYGDTVIAHAGWLNLTDPEHDIGGQLPFTALVHASFSAFDEIIQPAAPNPAVSFTSIGLPAPGSAPGDMFAGFARQLGDSVETCLHGDRRRRWHRALRTLESDPIFAEAELSSLASGTTVDGTLPTGTSRRILDAFSIMSSGHKLALLAITQLVEKVEERALVLIDEPESHLHPPLLASFLRAVSDLLTDRNGVGIVATHSPVVLQEIPRACISVLRRSGSRQAVDRPRIETFGETISTLTRDVFGLEVTRSGFHRMLLDEIDGDTTFGQLEHAFGGRLGSEARAIALAQIAVRRAAS